MYEIDIQTVMTDKILNREVDNLTVCVTENENIIEVTDGETSLPATERRQEQMDTPNLDNESIQSYINDLRERGKDEEADRAEEMLL